MVAACSASSTGLCQGSTITAVPSRSVLVRAATQVSRLRTGRDLAEAGEMVLDHEGAVVAERLGLDVVFDVVAKALTAVEVRAAALGLGAAEQSEFHVAWPALRRSVGLSMHFLT